MKRLVFGCLLALNVMTVAVVAARAQFANGTNAVNCNIAGTPGCPAAAAIGGPIGSPTYVMPPSSGVINIGQALGPFLQPYIDALVNALIAALVGWVALVAKNKFNVSIDEGHRDALITALQNQAGSLIADGLVKVEQSGKVSVTAPEAVAQSANEIMEVIPDAAKRLGLTPNYLAKRIMDTIPQTAAGAAMIAAAMPKPAAAPAPAAAPKVA